MSTICRWCSREMPRIRKGQGKDESSDRPCETCWEDLDLKRGPGDQGSLDKLPAAILVFQIHAGTYIITSFANSRACEVLGKDHQETVQHLMGNVLACAHALHPEGCGRSPFCCGCRLKEVIMETKQHDYGLSDVHAMIPRTIDHRTIADRLVVSTAKSGDLVILRIDRITVPG